MRLENGSKVAIIEKQGTRWNVYVGYKAGSDCPGEETVPARWFKGYSTCSQDFATEKTALARAHAFLAK